MSGDKRRKIIPFQKSDYRRGTAGFFGVCHNPYAHRGDAPAEFTVMIDRPSNNGILRLPMCRACAEKYAEKHGLEI